MPTIQELRKKADDFKKKQDFDNALPLYKQIWELEKSGWNGYFLSQCLRKTNNFAEAKELHQIVNSEFPTFLPIQNERLWLDYSEKIKNWENPNLLSDAKNILSKTNVHDKYTGSIFEKTVLSVAKFLIYHGDNLDAIKWLDKLDFYTLSTSPFNFQGIKFPSDQKAYFIRYADVLIKLDKHILYIESCLTALNFEGVKHSQFKKKIIEEITFGDYISRTVLALYIKNFKEEIYHRKNKLYSLNYNPQKVTRVSDVGDFEFCPVSFAIKETYSIPDNSTWEKDEWVGDKIHLSDRYKIFQKGKDFHNVFGDSTIEINETLENDFKDIFNSAMVLNNYDRASEQYFTNESDTLRGNPNYVFKNKDGERYAVIEKFTKWTNENIPSAFINDLLRLYGYIFELNTLKLDFGLFIYWFWFYDDIETNDGRIKKKIRIKSYKIFKAKKTDSNRKKLNKTINEIETFKQTQRLTVDGENISYANKCLHCSVFSYCNHKTGRFNNVNIPYTIDNLTIKRDPSWQ